MMAITVRDLHFSYSKVKPTLNGVNINVNEGSIYALLGPSGCGKTTLLDIIIGIRKPKSGTVFLYGYNTKSKESGVPGSGIGYMPQDISLQFDLTIGEILFYFGSIHFMTAKQIRNESQRLINRFNLPEKRRLVANLSGGQQRLVSLSVALIHKPRLLLLDEPTVGVDPLLRITFWDYLSNLCTNENVTTVITTHYVDEAKRANDVAFMRKGEILCEGKPNELMRTYNSCNLDQVFHELCSHQGPRRQSLAAVVEEENNYEPIEKKPVKSQNELSSPQKFFRIISTLVWKNFIEFRRNPTALLFLFCITFSTIMLVTVFFGSPPTNLPVAWVADEIRPQCDLGDCIDLVEHQLNRNITSAETNSSNFETENSISSDDLWRDYIGNIPYLPDILRNSIDTEIITLIDFPNVSLAMEAFEVLHVFGIIYTSSNFSEDYLRCDPFLIPDPNCELEETIKSGTIKLLVDKTNAIIYDSIKISIEYSVLKFREKIVKTLEIPEHISKIPISFRNLDETLNTMKTLKLVWFVIPGFIVIMPFGFSAGLALLHLVSESDLKVRNYASGVTLPQVLLSEVITQFIVMSLSASINLFASIYIFNVPCERSLFLVVSLMLLQVMLGLSFGLFFSSMFSKSMLSIFTSLMLLTTSVFTSGTIWSVEAQPIIFQYLNYCFPFLHSVKGMRILLLKKDVPMYPHISNGFLFSIAWIVLAYSAALLFSKYKK